jgi:hypothetical protein
MSSMLDYHTHTPVQSSPRAAWCVPDMRVTLKPDVCLPCKLWAAVLTATHATAAPCLPSSHAQPTKRVGRECPNSLPACLLLVDSLWALQSGLMSVCVAGLLATAPFGFPAHIDCPA